VKRQSGKSVGDDNLIFTFSPDGFDFSDSEYYSSRDISNRGDDNWRLLHATVMSLSALAVAEASAAAAAAARGGGIPVDEMQRTR